jgi:hypothetical protein
MNRAAAVSFALLFGATALAAQTVITRTAPDGAGVAGMEQLGKAGNQKEIGSAQFAMNTCPVALRAQQSAAAFSRQVDGAPRRDVAQLLHLTVSGLAPRKVATANVTVHGFANKPRMVETMTTQVNPDAAKSFDVRFAVEPGSEPSSELWVPGLSAVSSIDVNSVTYSDGSTWKLAAGGSCNYPVDGVMLIGSH